MKKRVLAVAAAGGVILLTSLVTIYGGPSTPNAKESVVRNQPAPIVAQANYDTAPSSEQSVTVAYNSISSISDKEFYLYFFSPT